MTKKHPKHVPFPSKEEVIDFIKTTPSKVGRREIARAFSIKGANRATLNQLLATLAEEGHIERGHKRRFNRPGTLPDVTMLEVSGTDTDGELMARPLAWNQEGPPPKIFVAPDGRSGSMGIGDRALCKLKSIGEHTYEARVIRRIQGSSSRVLGLFETGPNDGRIMPTDRRDRSEYLVQKGDEGGAEDKTLVLADVLEGRRLGLRQARVIQCLGDDADTKSFSLISIHTHAIPDTFAPEAIAQAEAAVGAPLGKRTDLRNIPLVTIDGEDARDFDDAVFAEKDGDGWHLIVAIADVSWYVRPGDDLDKGAYERGNSVYFPDCVVPMLPEALSNGWCSLRPDEERPCMAVHMWIDGNGNKTKHKFVRGLMKSAARLTYTQAQNAVDGITDETTAPITESIIKPLYGAYEALKLWRAKRGTLELDLPEKKIEVGDDGKVTGVNERPRFDSHKLIEEFMISANVAAAEELERLHQPCMYRAHDKPSMDKVESLGEFLASMDISLAKGNKLTADTFNGILKKVADTPESHLVSMVVLRSQCQAEYTPNNCGHFGLGLGNYAHFTSPIRRYADLLVHRALIAGLKLGDGGLPQDMGERYLEIGEHISSTERRASVAERDAVDRFCAAFMAEKIGATFSGRINGVTRFGLFVTLAETGADGLLPIARLPNDYYDHDERAHSLIGRRSRKTYRLGDILEVVLSEANPVTGSLTFQLAGLAPEDEKGAVRGGARRNAGKNTGKNTGKRTGKRKKRKNKGAKKGTSEK